MAHTGGVNLALSTELMKRGVSVLAARQLLAGEPIASPLDRKKVATIMDQALDLASPEERQQVALLLPAVQKVREAAMTPGFFDALLSSSTVDRAALTEVIGVLIGALGRSSASPQLSASSQAARKVPGLSKAGNVTFKRG